jgi:hypothetical protein
MRIIAAAAFILLLAFLSHADMTGKVVSIHDGDGITVLTADHR